MNEDKHDAGIYDTLLGELSELCGILPEYWDIFGQRRTASRETKKAVLRSMRVKVDSIDDLRKEVAERRSKQWRTLVGPVHVFSVNAQPLKIPLHVPVAEGEESRLFIEWSMADEKGRRKAGTVAGPGIQIADQSWLDGTRYIRVYLLDTDRRDIGYYTLQVTCKHPRNIFSCGSDMITEKSRIIITPDACHMPLELQKKRAWGLSVNLYSIRSGRNWGVGDLADLKKIVRQVAGLGGHCVGINPLHAIPNSSPFGTSPYSPLSRLYRNFIYLHIEDIPEVGESDEARRSMASGRFRKAMETLKKGDFVDYEKTAQLKERILRKAFDFFYRKYFGKPGRGAAFEQYRRKEGSALESFALFMSLWGYMKRKEGVYAWQQWPAKYRDISSEVVRDFRASREKEILFYEYLQWLIEMQLKDVSGYARRRGMEIGLYHDLAVGSVGGGSDDWCNSDVLASGAAVGAPPDHFSPEGQKWGFPPMVPEQLKESGYELFIQTIRKNMKHAGAIRIDHALGLFRLFWIPDGVMPKDGAYVNYPSEDLLRIIALESVRNRTMVIAEDLGTIGENVRETLKRFQMLSYRLFYFERNYPSPSFLAPDKYPALALCAVTTHDLPTLYGYWRGRDLSVRKRLGKIADEDLWNRQVEERKRDKGLIISALEAYGLLPQDDRRETADMTYELCFAIYRYLALTPCRLLLVSLDDIIGTLDQQNMPGTVDSYPNWMRKTPLFLEDLSQDKRLGDLSRVLRPYFE